MHPGDLIGAYRIDVVGTSDFAVTHLATQRQARLRWVEPKGDPAEFVQAARRICGLSAPTLHGLIDAGIEQRRCYLVDAPLPGEGLLDHIGRVGALTDDALLAFAESLFGALVELHNRQLFDGALHPGRLRIMDGQVRLTEPGVGRFLPALAPPADFTLPDADGVAADLFGAAALVCFAAHGRALPPSTAADRTGLAAPIVELLKACLGLEGERPTADAVRRTIQAVRAGTLAPDAPTPGAGGEWLTDASVDPPAPQHYDVADVPDELPTARAPIGHISAPDPNPAPAAAAAFTPPKPPARPPARAATTAARRPASSGPSKAPIAIAIVLLLAGVGGVLAWRAVAPVPAPIVDPPTPAPSPIAEPASAATAASVASAAPATVDKYAHVTLVAQPGPARFVQVESKTVLCESETTCQVPIDIDTRVEKEGYTPRVLSGDDLYDQRGNRWTIHLRSLP